MNIGRLEEFARASASNDSDSILDATPIIFARCGRDLRYRYVNRAAANLLGHAPDEIVGRPIAEIMGEAAFESIRPYIDRVLRGEPLEFETEIPYSNAGKRWMRANYQPERDERGEVTGWIASIVDATDRHQAELALVESEASLQTLSEAVPAMVWMCAPDGTVTYVNDRWTEYTGRTGLAKYDWADVVHPEDLESVRPRWEHALLTGDVYDGEIRYRRHDGVYRWHYFRGVARRNDRGEIVAWYGTSLDIHDKKVAENEIRESEERFRGIFETAGVSVWVEDFTAVVGVIEELRSKGVGDFREHFQKHPKDLWRCVALTRVVDANQETLSLFSARSKSELMASFEKIFTLETQPAFLEELVALAEGRPLVSSEGILHTIDGRRLTVVFTVHFGAGTDYSRVVLTITDITARKHAEDVLRHSEEQFRSVFEMAGVSVWVEDFTAVKAEIDRLKSDGIYDIREYFASHHDHLWRCIQMIRVLDVNKETLELFGVPDIETLLARTDFGTPECTEVFIQEMVALAEGRRTVRAEAVVRTHDGRRLSLMMAVHFPPAHDMSRVVFTLTDISVRKQAEDLLRVSEERFKQLIYSMPAAVYTCDAESRITLYNAAAAQLWGREPVLGSDSWCGSWKIFTVEGNPLPLEACPMAITLKDGRPLRGVEIIVERPDGTRRNVLANPEPIRDTTGRVIGAINMLVDITERKRAEHALRESEERQRIAAAAAGLGIFEWSLPDTLTWENDRIYEIFGRTRAQGPLSRKEFLDNYVHPDDAERLKHVMNESARTRTPMRTACRIRRSPVETWRWLELAGQFTFGADGAPVKMAAVVADISERIEAEQALRESEARFSRFMQHLPGHAWIKDAEGRYVFTNDSPIKLIGAVSSSQLLGRTDDEIYPPDIAERFRRSDREASASESGIQFYEALTHPDGIKRHSVVSKFAIPDPRGEAALIGGIAIDITDLKRAEEALRESEARFSRFMQHLPGLAWIKDPDGRYIFANEGACRAFGATISELYGKTDEDVFPPATAEAFKRNDDDAYASEAGVQVIETLGHPDGTLHHSVVNKFAIPGPNGEAAMIGGMAIDITGLKHAEEALRESEARFRDLADNIAQFAWMADETGAIFWYNKRWFDYTGMTLADMEGWGWRKIHHRDHVERVTEKYKRCVESGEVWEDTFPLRGADGQFRWFLSRAIPIRDGSGRVVRWFGTNTDVTEHMEAEEELRQAHANLERRVAERTSELRARAEQLVRLTSELTLTEQRERERLAQILHDHLQQLLVAARLRFDVIARVPKEIDNELALELRGLLDEALTASRSLTVELAPPILYEAGLGAGLEWLARWMKSKHGIDVELDVDDEASTEREDVRVLLFQSIRELLFNVVKHAGINKAAVSLSLVDNGHLCATVADDGGGFDTQAAMKSNGKDKEGFGLFSIRERVMLLGGSLSIQSAPGAGSLFTLILPRGESHAEADASVQSEPYTPVDLDQAARARGTRGRNARIRVLLVDDHDVLRRGLVSVLAGEPDLEVVGEAADGIEAVEKAFALDPDLILMDFSMPLLDGVEATRRIKAGLPHIAIIGLSMYDERDRAAAMVNAGATAYVCKSESLVEIIAAIRSARAGETPERA